MDYFVDREQPIELEYPGAPFDDRVANLAARSWFLRAALSLAAAVLAVDVEWTALALDPVVSPLSEFLVAVAAIFALDAVRTVRGYPRLHGEEPTITTGRLVPSVRVGLVGGALWTGGLVAGGEPHLFAAAVAIPLVAGVIPVGLLGRYFSLPRRLFLAISGTSGGAVALPFLGNAPPFVPPAVFPTTDLTGTILGGVLGLTAMLAAGVGIAFGVPLVSRLAWELRCRSTATVVPQNWDLLVTLPIVLAVLSTWPGVGDLSPLAESYASAVVASGLSPSIAGLVFVWTVPAVAVGLAGRLWLGSRLSGRAGRVRSR
jgi:hypothetical protein